MKPQLIVVDEHRGGDVHGVDQTKTFGHAAPVNEFLDLRCDVDEPASIRYFEPKMFSERFHSREVEVGSSGTSIMLKAQSSVGATLLYGVEN